MTRFPWHTFLAVLVPIVSMYASQPGASASEEIVRSALVACAVAGALLAVAMLVYRDLRKAGLLVTGVIVLFLAFGAIYNSLESVQLAGIRPFRRAIAIPATYLLFAALAWRIFRTRRPLLQLTGLANVVALGCLLVPVYSLVRFEVATFRYGAPALPLPAAAATATATATATAVKPDIYYIVFDRYGDAATMRQYGFDNSPFYRFLENKGFYVASGSRSNYVKTVLSLASSLNMSYLDPLQAAEGRDSRNWRPVYQWIREPRIVGFLRTQGYRYVHVGSWYWPTEVNPIADRNVNFYTTVPRAVMGFLDNELLAPFRRLAPLPAIDERAQQYYRVPRQIDDVVSHAGDAGPTFTFVHILVPHPPYVFDRDGGWVTLDEEAHRTLQANYTHQVAAANAMATRLIEGILAKARTPPVIVLQGDEGPYPDGTTSTRYNWHTASVTELREKSGILNAYLLPGGGDAGLYPTVSPVNSFRLVLNTYFGTALPLLPDRVFAHESEESPYFFTELTDTLNPPRRAATAGAAAVGVAR